MADIQERIGKDGKTRYTARVRMKGHPTQVATFTRKTDMNKWIQDTESAIRQRRHFHYAEAKKHTVSEMIDRYVENVLPTKPASMTRDRKPQLDWWKAEIGERVLADVNPTLIAECRDKLLNKKIRQATQPKKKKPTPDGETKRRETLSEASVNRYLAALRRVYTLAVKEWRWAHENPVALIEKPKEPRGRVRFLSDDERERLLAECRKSVNDALYPVVVLALSTGMRRGEIMGLTWNDVDLKQGRVFLEKTKNGERRAVPLVGLAHELLSERAKLRRIDTAYLFPSPSSAKPVDIRSAFVAAVKRGKIKDFRFHDLRHSCASYLAMRGVSLREIGEILGHKSPQVTQRYAHLSESHTSRIVTEMSAEIFAS